MPSSVPTEACAVGDAARAVPPIRAGDVPARGAQPGRRGPSAAQTEVATTASGIAMSTPVRNVMVWPVPGPIRQAMAATTIIVEPATSATDHDAGASVPVPSE